MHLSTVYCDAAILSSCHPIIPAAACILYFQRKQRIEKSETPAGLGGRVAVASDSKEFYSWSWSYSLSWCCEYSLQSVGACHTYKVNTEDRNFRHRFLTIPHHRRHILSLAFTCTYLCAVNGSIAITYVERQNRLYNGRNIFMSSSTDVNIAKNHFVPHPA